MLKTKNFDLDALLGLKAERKCFCEKHGIEYTEKQFRNFTRGCPKCDNEAALAYQEEMQAQREREQREYLERITTERLGASGIPPRYLKKSVKSYELNGDEQQKFIVAQIKTYISEFTGLKHSGRHLALLGNTGTGKTHLACAAARYVIQQGGMARFMSLSELARIVRESKGFDSEVNESQVIQAFGNYDLLVIDEVGVQSGSEAEYRAFFDVFNERHNRMKPTILISNLGVDAFREAITQRIFDRILEDGGEVLGFDWNSHRG